MSDLYDFIAGHQSEFAISVMCETLEISRSGFSRYCLGAPSTRSIADEKLGEKISAILNAK